MLCCPPAIFMVKLILNMKSEAGKNMKKLTINEIAERAGVSKTTVSFYLNGKTNKMSEETMERIRKIIEETGYEPNAAARALKSKSGGVIGVILGDLSQPFAAKALKGIEEEANLKGYQVLVGASGMSFSKEEEYIESMSGLGVAGFIIQATYRFGILGMELEKRNRNLVYLDVSPYDTKGKSVKSGNYTSVYEAISQCVKKGYEQFIIISDGSQDDYGGVANAQGFKDALREAGKTFKVYYLDQDDTEEAVGTYLHQQIDAKKKTLIYVSDASALQRVYGAVKQLEDYQSLMPEKLGLIGFDISGWTKMTTPPITAIVIPAYQEGRMAARQLLDMIHGKGDSKEVVLKNKIIWRESTM